VTSLNDAVGNRGHLIRRLSLAKHDLRVTLSDSPVMIDPGEPQVFEGSLAHEL
jgi:hypothetical protein